MCSQKGDWVKVNKPHLFIENVVSSEGKFLGCSSVVSQMKKRLYKSAQRIILRRKLIST